MNRKDYDRVTKVLKVINDPGLNYALEHKAKLMEEKRNAGTKLHGIAADFVQGKPVNARLAAMKHNDPDTAEYFRLYLEWLDTACEKIYFAEEPVYDDDYWVLGHPDICVIIRGNKWPSVPDLKRTSSISPRYPLQIGQYCHMVGKRLNEKRVDGGPLRFDKGKVMPFRPIKDIVYQRQLFLHALALHRGLK